MKTVQLVLWWYVLALEVLIGVRHFGGAALSPPPFACNGLHVLIVEESSLRKDLPAGQYEIIMSKAPTGVIEWMNIHNAKATSGVPEWRNLDQDDKTDLDDKWVQDAMAVPRESVPWVVASNGRTGFSIPLPKTPAELIAKLSPLGGK